jgi:hypothetical protein
MVDAASQSSDIAATAREAVASMLFESGNSFYLCTGALVADTDATSVIPYFLTAHQCISRADEAASLETYFDDQRQNSNGDTLGATIKATSPASDFTLLRLASTPVTADGITTYLGWTSSPVADSDNLALYRVSHPKGVPQAYSEGVVDTGKPTCGKLSRGNFIYSRDTLDAIESGSSGRRSSTAPARSSASSMGPAAPTSTMPATPRAMPRLTAPSRPAIRPWRPSSTRAAEFGQSRRKQGGRRPGTRPRPERGATDQGRTGSTPRRPRRAATAWPSRRSTPPSKTKTRPAITTHFAITSTGYSLDLPIRSAPLSSSSTAVNGNASTTTNNWSEFVLRDVCGNLVLDEIIRGWHVGSSSSFR